MTEIASNGYKFLYHPSVKGAFFPVIFPCQRASLLFRVVPFGRSLFPSFSMLLSFVHCFSFLLSFSLMCLLHLSPSHTLFFFVLACSLLPRHLTPKNVTLAVVKRNVRINILIKNMHFIEADRNQRALVKLTLPVCCCFYSCAVESLRWDRQIAKKPPRMGTEKCQVP